MPELPRLNVKLFRCWICNKQIDNPLYWIDPKFFPQFNEIKYLCGPPCAHKAREKIEKV